MSKGSAWSLSGSRSAEQTAGWHKAPGRQAMLGRDTGGQRQHPGQHSLNFAIQNMAWNSRVSPSALVVKNPTATTGDIRYMISIPGLGRSPGEGHGNPPQYSCLENPMDRGPWGVAGHRMAKSQMQLKWLSTHARTHLGHNITSAELLPVTHNLNLIMRKHQTILNWGKFYKNNQPLLFRTFKVKKDKNSWTIAPDHRRHKGHDIKYKPDLG